MNNQISENIRRLRLSVGMTQEQLADKIGVTPQSVSKWENGVSAPDIALLPELSVIFGVTIDELFTLTDEARYERIENMLYDVRFISEHDFQQTEAFLKERYSDEKERPKAGLLLAQLYNKRADEYHQLAAPLAKRALLDNPDCKEAHNAVFDSDNGVYIDWNFTNHHTLIDWYKSFIAQHPDSYSAYLWLMDLLLADCRTQECREYLEKSNQLKKHPNYAYYRSRICRAEGRIDKAEEWLQKLLTEYDGVEWSLFLYANEMARLCRYDEAICYYEKSRPLRKKPMYVDTEMALAHLYEITGNIEKAIEMNEAILELERTDWNETEGETVDMYTREIERLKHLLEKKQ